jgi:hypothetical protein
MSTHPNAILLLALTPHGLARKTMEWILRDAGIPEGSSKDVKIGDDDYHYHVMEEDYYEDMQVFAKEGDLVFFDFVTYGYGERIAWSKLEAQKASLEEWARTVCAKHACDYAIFITANFW